jgi:Flp pilus assembly protein CpaB
VNTAKGTDGMSDTAVAPPPVGDRVAFPARPVHRRQPLPTGRAVVGGFLVAASALGIYTAWASAAAGPDERFTVARRDLPIGHRVEAGDLELQPMDLPATVARSAFSDPRVLVGSTVVGPVRAGELVQAGDVVESSSAPTALEVSFAAERSRAVAGTLRPGEFVDVLATFGAGGDTYTTTVVAGARVVAADERGGGIVAGEERIVTLAVASADDARALAHAVNAGEVVLVRSHPPAGGAGAAARSGTYRAPSAGDGRPTGRTAG